MGQKRERGAVLFGLALVGFVACGGATSHGVPGEATPLGGSSTASGGSAPSEGGSSTAIAGKSATPGPSGGSPANPPSLGGAPPDPTSTAGASTVAGGAPPEIGGAPTIAGGAPPEAGGAPPSVSSGGAPNCDKFDEAWLATFCDKYGDPTPDTCSNICTPQRSACLAKCGACGDCATPIACDVCRRASVVCKARCAAQSLACTRKCVRNGELCDALEAEYPDCEKPLVTSAP